ncbi:MAG: flagellar hook-associated protein FlgK [Pseudomonadota bacterium]
MSLNGALSNAVSGLAVTSRTAEVISDNVANALTEGYSARDALLAQRRIGGGVEVLSVERRSDPQATADRRAADAASERARTLAAAQTRLADLLGGPGDPAALASRAVAFESALERLADTPESETLQTAAAAAARDLVAGLNAAADGVQAMRRDADAAIARDVAALNEALATVERLNADIRRAAGRPERIALEEARDAAVDVAAEMIPLRVVRRADGEIALYAPAGAVLLDGRAGVFGFAATPAIGAGMTVGGGALSGLMLNGRPAEIGTGSGRFDGGRLGAAFEIRDRVGIVASDQLDALAADLVQRLEDPAVDPTLAVGDPGLFTDAGAAFSAAAQTGLASRLTLNAAADPQVGGEARRLRDGVASPAAGPSGEDALPRAMLAALTDRTAPAAATGLIEDAGFADLVAGIAGLALSARASAETEASFQSGRVAGFAAAEDVASGVTTDDELARLLAVEQAYAANARVVQTVDSLLRQLLEI